jgi:ubiquinone/menaquinone biosynthesis C-methylase UbiE
MKRLEAYLTSIHSTIYTEPKIDYHEKIIDQAFDAYVKNRSFSNALDVGFGTGYSLDKFKALGINVTGITMDLQEFAAMKEHDVRMMDLNLLDFEDESFDLVWCRHALEHSVMPFIALLEYRRVLKNGGYLYVEVPQDEAVHVDNPNHYSMLSDRSWQALMRKAKLNLINRGQWTIHLDGWIDIYWNYWLKKEGV